MSAKFVASANIKGTPLCNHSFPISQLTRSFVIIHLVRTQHFPKNFHFLPPNTHSYVLCVRTKWMIPFSFPFFVDLVVCQRLCAIERNLEWFLCLEVGV